MSCKRCKKQVPPNERASYRSLCEDCWVASTMVGCNAKPHKKLPRELPTDENAYVRQLEDVCTTDARS